MRKVNNTNKNFFLYYLGNNVKGSASPIPASIGFISPGDVLSFRYETGTHYRTVLIVSIDRGPGTFISTRGNLLIACFRLDWAHPEILKIVLKEVYKKRSISNYYKLLKAMNLIFGTSNFRSYMLSKMRYVHEIQLDLSKVKWQDIQDN